MSLFSCLNRFYYIIFPHFKGAVDTALRLKQGVFCSFFIILFFARLFYFVNRLKPEVSGFSFGFPNREKAMPAGKAFFSLVQADAQCRVRFRPYSISVSKARVPLAEGSKSVPEMLGIKPLL